ncbi:hypothetical protein ACFQV2_40365 [Actinokineospora soli]|uniref:Uncharacterized protein n=1 Tax=Actinokineospora soli TaxID=1048753 RepID=A0ABW2TYT9_9PSEU
MDNPNHYLEGLTEEADHYPDGLTEEAIDRLMAEVFSQVEPVRPPTSPFATSEDARRLRRSANQRMARVVRVLPVAAAQMTEPDGRAA